MACLKNFDCLMPFFEMYEDELQQLMIDLDKLVEIKKLRWTNKIKQSEAKLAEEKRLHNRTKSIIALKEVEIAKLLQQKRMLKEFNETATSEYEVQIANLKKSTDLMEANLSKLQLKYNEWRSRPSVRERPVRVVRTENALSEELSKGVQTAPFSPPIDVTSQLFAKGSEIGHNRDHLNSIESAFRSQIRKFEIQLNEILNLKRIQDKETKTIAEKQLPQPSTRDVHIQWPPSLPSTIKSDVSLQVMLKPKTQSVGTLTNSKYMGPSESDIMIRNLEDGLVQKDVRLRELENAYSVAMDMIESLKSELEVNRMSLAQKSSELSQQKLRFHLRGRRAFTSKACQSESVGCCDQEIDVNLVRTREIMCQTENDGLPSTVPGFLAEALMSFDNGQHHVSSMPWNESALSTGRTSCHNAQAMSLDSDKETKANAQIGVNISVDIVDVSNEGGTDVHALLASWKSAEDQWVNQLGDNSTRSSPVWRIEKAVKDTTSAPAISVTTVPATTTIVTVSTSDGVNFSPLWNSNDVGEFDGRVRQFDKQEAVIPLPKISTISEFPHDELASTQDFLKSIPQLSFGTLQTSDFVLTPVMAAGGTWDGHNRSKSSLEDGGCVPGLRMWDDDDIEQLAVQFLTSEREHSAQLDAAIERHLENLRLDVHAPCPPLVPSAQ